MHFHVDSIGGVLVLGNYSITWSNRLDTHNDYLEGFTSFNFPKFSIEFGDIDQGTPGIYITRYADGDVESSTPIILFR